MNAKLFAISYDPVTYKGEKGMDAMPAIRFFFLILKRRFTLRG